MGGHGSGRKPDLVKQFKDREAIAQTGGGDSFVLPNLSGDHSRGRVTTTPTTDFQIANKKYVDDNVGTHTESSTDSLTNKTIDSFTNDVEADEIHIQVRNESGSSMSKGDVVYISGYSVGQDKPLVSLADANGASTYPALAMINDSAIANNATGHATVQGRVFDIDTNAFSAGDTAYLSETAGELSTKPTGTSQVQAIGIVLRSHASNGVLEVIGAGRTNDLPNIANTKIWIGDTNGVPQEFTLSGDATMTAGGVVTIDHVNIDSIGTNSHAQIDTHIADTTDAHTVSSDTLTFTNKTIDANGTGNSITNIDLTADVINDLPITEGGTGQSTQTAAFDALSPLTTQGDVMYHNGSDNVRLGPGTANSVLTTAGAAANPTWGKQYYVLSLNLGNGHSPLDGQTLFYGQFGFAATGGSILQVEIPKTGTIERADLFILVSPTLGSSENTTASIRLNDTSDTTISAVVKHDATTQTFTNSGLSIAVTAGDYIEGKFVFPTFTTNPTVCYYTLQVLISIP